MKYVNRDEAIDEIRFQQNEMRKFMEGWIEEFSEHPRKYKRSEVMKMLKDMSLEYFDIIIHGIEEHMEWIDQD